MTDLGTCWRGPELRPYQLDALAAMDTAGSGIVRLPPGAGKTLIAAAKIISTCGAGRWLYLTARRDVADQSHRRFAEWGLDASAEDDDESDVVVTTFARALKVLAESPWPIFTTAIGLIVDEPHAVGAPTFAAVVDAVATTERFGLGATPLARSDGKNAGIVERLGPVIFDLPAADLIQQGYLADGVVHFSPFHVGEQQGAEWHRAYDSFVASHPERNALLIEQVAVAPKPCLVLARRIPHAAHLAAEIAMGNERTGLVHGQMPVAERAEALTALRQGTLDVLVASGIFDEGVDVPELRSVVVAAAGKSTIRAVQRMGRAARPAPGKEHFIVYDVWDGGHPWFENHSEKRALAYAEAGLPVEVAARPLAVIATDTDAADTTAADPMACKCGETPCRCVFVPAWSDELGLPDWFWTWQPPWWLRLACLAVCAGIVYLSCTGPDNFIDALRKRFLWR